MVAVSRSASTPRERMSASVMSGIGSLKMAAAAGKVWPVLIGYKGSK